MAQTKIDPNEFKETIIQVNIAEKSEEWQKIYGANKNLYRYFPSLVDGLKPVERRFLYALYKEGRYKGRLLKLARAASNAVEFHPHGDSSIADVGIGMSQEWANNCPLTHTPGNNGDIRGNDAAAPRYLDIEISDFGYDCFFSDFANSSVDMRISYTGESFEPITLPSKYPVAMINGGFSSIGYAFSSDIVGYNFKEICETCIALIDDPDAKILIYPDLPTGCDLLMTKKEAKELFEKAENDVKIKMRAHANIDYLNNIITFTSVPMQVTTTGVTDNINKLILNGELPEVKHVNDRTTDQDGLILEIVLNDKYKDEKTGSVVSVNPDEVLKKLYKAKTNLKKNNASSIILIDDFVAKMYSVREVLLSWIDYRRDTVRASLNSRMSALLEKEHINHIKVFLCQADNIEKTLSIAKKSKNEEEYKDALMKAYNITSLQASTIAKMPTSAFNKDARLSFKDEGEKLTAEINELEKIIESDSKVDKLIIQELKDGIAKYGRERRSIVYEDENACSVNNSCVVGITDDGFIKKVLQTDKAIGSVSKDSSSMMTILPAEDTDTIMLFTSDGNRILLQTSAIPLSKPKHNGFDIGKFIKLGNTESIVSATVVPKNAANMNDYFFVLITKQGFMKRVSISSFFKGKDASTSQVAKAIVLNSGDELSTVVCTEDSNRDIIVFTDYGDGVRFNLSDIKMQLPNSKGDKMISLKGKEIVCGCNLMNGDDKYLVYATSSGKLKRTELQYFPVMSRKDEPICLINLDNDEYLVTVKSIKGNEKLTFFKKKGEPEVIKASDIPVKARASKADKMVRCNKGDIILSMVIK